MSAPSSPGVFKTPPEIGSVHTIANAPFFLDSRNDAIQSFDASIEIRRLHDHGGRGIRYQIGERTFIDQAIAGRHDNQFDVKLS